MKKTLLIFFVFSLICFSCYYDSEEALFPVVDTLKTACDTTNITYTGNIANIINNYCLNCHNIQVPVLTSFETVVTYSDRIYGDIAHKSGFDPMPKSPAPMLDSCTIKQFGRWIKEGKPKS
jgi:hypothetical protein